MRSVFHNIFFFNILIELENLEWTDLGLECNELDLSNF